jgi:hypothetical protein
VILEPTGTQTFIYNGDLSAPQGDLEDWIAFIPYDQVVFASLECSSSDGIKAHLLENNLPIDTYIKCGSQVEQLAVMAGSTYILHLEAVTSEEILQYTNYILTIKSRP